jgi:lysophospholipase L1-like esterase
MFHMAIAAAFGALLNAAMPTRPLRAQAPVTIVALGDSLTAGYGLPAKDGFVPRLQAALSARGFPRGLQMRG